MAITDTLNLNAQQVAEQNPELHQMRQKFFGQDYLSDIAQGTGTAQYYTGFGDPNFLTALYHYVTIKIKLPKFNVFFLSKNGTPG